METLDAAILSRLRLVSRHRRQGGWGERRSTRRGQGLEFADYRDYTPGDDLRRVDWNLYARLDRPYVRLYEEEVDLHVHLLLDASESMAWGEGQSARWPKARALALALGTIALLNNETLSVGLLRAGHIEAFLPHLRGRAAVQRWTEWVAAVDPPQGPTDLAASIRHFAMHRPRPGLTLLIGDGYDPDGLEAGVKHLAAKGQEIIFLHLLTPEEIAPPPWGEVQLIDAETGTTREVTIDRAARTAYRARFERWVERLRRLFDRYGGRYRLLRSDRTLRQIVLEELRRAAILR